MRTLKAQAAIAEATESFIAAQTKVFFDSQTFEATGNSDMVDQVIKNVVKETQLRCQDQRFQVRRHQWESAGLRLSRISNLRRNLALVDQIKKDLN